MRATGLVVAIALAVQGIPTASGAVLIDRVGVMAGVSLSQMRYGNPTYGLSDWRAGVVGGPFLLVNVSNRIAVQPAIVFAQRGGTYRDLSSMLWGGEALVDEFSVKRHYLELPVLFRYRIWTESELAPSLILGPACGWVLSSENLEDGEAYPDQSGKHDLAVVVGLGIARMAEGASIGVDITYRRALTGLADGMSADAFRADGVDVVISVGF